MKATKWPFMIDHITDDGDSRGLEGTGIISSRHLQGIQSEMCHEVRQPTTIVEFAKDGTPVRTDSPLLTYAMHPSCRRFREANLICSGDGAFVLDENKEPLEGDLCLRCDSCHANIFRGMKEHELNVDNLIERMSQVTDLDDMCIRPAGCSSEPLIHYGRLLLQYDCPLLGYRELLFPIIFESKVIAVFFVGQITLENKQEFIEAMIESLPSRFHGCFDAYLGKCSNMITPMSIAEEVLQEHARWLREDPKNRIVSPTRYEGIISTTIKELKEFENLLGDEIQHQRLAYIRQRVSLELKEFARPSELSLEPEKVDEDNLKNLWGRVEDSMNRLVESFSLQYALAFGVRQIIHAPGDKLEVVAKTERWAEVFDSEEAQHLSIDPEGLPDSYLVCSMTQNQQYLECLQGRDLNDLGDFQLVLVPVAPYPYSSIAFLLGYKKEHPSTTTLQKLK